MICLVIVAVTICCPLLCFCCCCCFAKPEGEYQTITTTTVTRNGVTESYVNKSGGPDMVFTGPVHGYNQQPQTNPYDQDYNQQTERNDNNM